MYAWLDEHAHTSTNAIVCASKEIIEQHYIYTLHCGGAGRGGPDNDFKLACPWFAVGFKAKMLPSGLGRWPFVVQFVTDEGDRQPDAS